LRAIELKLVDRLPNPNDEKFATLPPECTMAFGAWVVAYPDKNDETRMGRYGGFI
jgi:hypothetical protein